MLAFEMTEEDVSTVLGRYGLKTDDQTVSLVAGLLDREDVANAAVDADLGPAKGDLESELDLQTAAAHDNITVQLVKLGVVPLAKVEAAGHKLVLAEVLGCDIPETLEIAVEA